VLVSDPARALIRTVENGFMVDLPLG
jgi:hypothetical protein